MKNKRGQFGPFYSIVKFDDQNHLEKGASLKTNPSPCTKNKNSIFDQA